ncbi:MAG: heavy-metal-associated domain-containing protein [Ignavibacteriaceae bacterium]
MELTFRVEGMSCAHCVMAVKKELNKANILDYNVEIGSVKIENSNNDTDPEVVKNAIEAAGYKVISVS